MFNIDYDLWLEICEYYLSINERKLNKYLQWYPLSLLKNKDSTDIKDKGFYEKYIANGNFVLYERLMLKTDNYLQKNDGSYRESSLISPILYLVIQCIGKQYANHYSDTRDSNIICFYAGNYKTGRLTYKTEYDSFYKTINQEADSYEYYIKTDLSNFYHSINVDLLFQLIDEKINSNNVIPTNELYYFKQLLRYLGNGHFPLIENSVASSFLATKVYLENIDNELANYYYDILNINDFVMIRYVDDLYILFNNDSSKAKTTYLDTIKKYNSILKPYGLTLNSKKCVFGITEDISKELAQSTYDDSWQESKEKIPEVYELSFKNFLEELSQMVSSEHISFDEYSELMDKHFSNPEYDYSSKEVLNYFVYDYDEYDNQLKELIFGILGKQVDLVYIDPKRITSMLLKTDSTIIKKVLSNLFVASRDGRWTIYHSSAAIMYLLQSGFRHIDLLDVLSQVDSGLYEYYFYYCKNPKYQIEDSNGFGELLNTVLESNRETNEIYFMYLCEDDFGNYMSKFTIFKSFFDRVSAMLAAKYIDKEKKPNYNRYHLEKNLSNLYSKIDHSHEIIIEAHTIRKTNPVVHGSAQYLRDTYPVSRIQQSINNQRKLLIGLMEMVC